MRAARSASRIRTLRVAPTRAARFAPPKYPPRLRTDGVQFCWNGGYNCDGRAGKTLVCAFPVSNFKFSRGCEIRHCALGENLIVGDLSATTAMARVVSALGFSRPELTERLAVLLEVRRREIANIPTEELVEPVSM